MSDSIQTQGKTVNDAVSEALLQLGLRRDEVEIKVVEEPKSGLLGFIGSRPAKVMVRKKPERGRGRSRDKRSGDDGAHSLSGSGRSRNSRSRSGRDNQRGDNKDGRQDGRNRGSRRSQSQQPGGNEARTESRGDSRKGSRDEARSGARGAGGNRNSRQDERQTDKRQENNRQENNRRDNNRHGGRGRGARKDGEITVERTEEKTSRSRRGSRGGRGRSRGNQSTDIRNDERTEARAAGAGARIAHEAAPAKDNPISQAQGTADNITPVSKPGENINMTENQQNPNPQAEALPAIEKTPPAATTAETPTPVTKPRAKRKGWGGGLGSRLARKNNPAVKEKPEPVVVTAPEPTKPTPVATPHDDNHSRRDYRERRPSSVPDEIIIDAVAATKYAKSVNGVTQENLDNALAELAGGMLARAGFPCEVEVNEGEYRQVRISSDEESAGMLIGRHGQTVDAVEHLVERMACNAVDDRVRMNLDINGYRERRSELLRERVAEAIAGVRQTGKAYHVEPMSARERRLVHLEVEGVADMRTFTMIGSGGKYVVIALADEASDSQQSEG